MMKLTAMEATMMATLVITLLWLQYEGVGIHKQRDPIEAFLIGKDCTDNQALKEQYYKRAKVEDKTWRKFSINQKNQWPQDIQGADLFRKKTLEFWEGCRQASNDILSAMALSLDLEKNYFVDSHGKNDCTLEMKKYPPFVIPEPSFMKHVPPHLRGVVSPKTRIENIEEEDLVRVDEHSDLSSITLLIQTPNIDCLEILTSSNTWIKATAYPDTVLVNVGDVMERWTSGTFKSTRHRVVAASNHEALKLNRYSAVYFCVPDWETEISNDLLFGDMIPYQ